MCRVLCEVKENIVNYGCEYEFKKKSFFFYWCFTNNNTRTRVSQIEAIFIRLFKICTEKF